MKQKLLLLLAVFFGFLAFMLTYQQIAHEKEKIRKTAETVDLVAVTRDISANEAIPDDALQIVRAKMFRSQLAGSRYIRGGEKNIIVGKLAQFRIAKGTFLQWNDIQSGVATGREGVTSKVKPGYRAVSISVDQTQSVSGLIQPNNYVDIIGTFKFPDLKGDSSLDTITMTILPCVQVLATGSDYGMRINGKGGRSSYGTVTLMLLPKEVEMIIFATQKGRIHLSLRNYEDLAISHETQSVNWKYLQKNIEKYTKEREKADGLGGR